MDFRRIAILAILCLAVAFGGCRSKSNKDFDEVLMPLQTGSVLQRRVQVKADEEPKPKKEKKETKEKKKAPAPKPEAERSATPAPEEESTPPADRFR
jgi:ABC-type uncharacterized transport system involved in gliding motility auxiliary subunit